MRKTIILSIIFCAFFAYFPFTAQAADSVVTAVSVTPGSLVAGAEATHEVEFTTASTVSSGNSLWFTYATEGLGYATFGCDTAALDYADFDATFSCWVNSFLLQVTSDLAAGTYHMDLDLTNEDTVGNYILAGYTSGAYPDGTHSDAFTLTETATNPISSLAIENSSLYTGASNDIVWTVTTSEILSANSTLTFYFGGENVDSPDSSGYDFSNTSFTADDFTCSAVDVVPAFFQCINTTELAAGSYAISANGITNPSIAGYYNAFGTADALGSVVNYTESDVFELTELAAPGKIKKKYLKTKKIKKKSAKMKIKKAKARATFYKFRIEKKKKNKKGYKIKKTYKNVTKLKKKAKKLKRKTKHRWKVKACNDAGCSKWSKYKKFTTK